MKQVLFLSVLLLCGITAGAQDEQKHYINHHLFELSIGAGQGIGGYAIDKKTGNFSYAWAIKNSTIYSVGLSFHITKRISAGILGNMYKWDTRYAETYTSEVPVNHLPGANGGTSISTHRVEGTNTGYSACLTGNYDLPYRSSIFYGGINCGFLRGLDNKPTERGMLSKMEGMEINIHVGYKLTLVQKRFWLFLEAGSTSDISKQVGLWSQNSDKYFSINNYPLTGGLKFRI